jgi:hypothetical protein
VILFAAAAISIGLAFETAPRVAARDDVSPAEVEHAIALAKRHDPRSAPPGQLHRVVLPARDVDLLARYAARRLSRSDASVVLGDETLSVRASVAAPAGLWVNMDVELRQTDGRPVIDRVRVGRLSLPPALLRPLIDALAARQGFDADALLDFDWIERLSIANGELTATYRIGPDTIKRWRTTLVSPAEQRRLRVYAERLAVLSRTLDGPDVSMVRIIVPLFALASERSADQGDAVAETRAALLAVAFFANHRSLDVLVPAARDWPQPRPLDVTLHKRHDHPLHFLISAVIAAEAGTPLAEAVGLWKELADAHRGGSGFSFNDLAADRAGTRFGELAVRDPLRLQARLASGVTERDLMPDVSDLPESLTEAELTKRYGGVGGPAYNRVLAEIEARVGRLPVLQGP